MTGSGEKGGGITSFDVARRAGVSRAAVSRTFTPDASVSAKTREKVRKAAAELGYRVNYLARSLINQRSDLVGLVAAGMDNPFRALQIDHLARALLKRNFHPVLLPVDDRAGSTAIIEQLLHYSAAGVLVTSDAPPTSLCAECADLGVPIVLINKGDDISMVDRVVSDDEAAGQIAATTLLAAGSTRLGVIGAAAVSYSARRRQQAFVAECHRRGVVPAVIQTKLNDYQSGFAADVDAEINGLFCANDYLACGVIDRLRQDRTRRVPDDIRIIGHDDIPQAAWIAYALTTIQQPCGFQAEQAVTLLMSRMSQPALPARVECTPVTQVRRRTA